MKIICDIETDSLDPSVIWCVVCKDISTKKVYRFVKDEELEKYKDDLPVCYPLSKFPDFCKKVDVFIGHNFIKFDCPILNRLAGTKIKLSQIEDTYVMSQLSNPERWFGHGLGGWGNFLKFPKHPSPDFSKFTPYTLEYCEQDVDLNEKVYFILLKELEQFSKQSIDCEHKIAFYINQMCKNGVSFDSEKATELYAEVKEKETSLKKELKEHFPSFPSYSKTIEPRWTKEIKTKKGKISKPSRLSLQNRRSLPEKGEDCSIIYWKKWQPEFEDSLKRFLDEEMYKPHTDYKNKTEALRETIIYKYSNHLLVDDVLDVPDNLIEEERPFTIIDWIPFNPQSHTQVVKLLNNVGWKPYDKTKAHIKATMDYNKGKITKEELDEVAVLGWKINSNNLDTLPKDAPEEYQKLALYRMISSRESMLRKQYFPSVKNGRIYGDVWPLGAVTNRMTHKNPNLANIVAIHTEEVDGVEVPLKGEKGRYGFEMRELFKATNENYVLLGTDAEQLELRMMAHDMRDENFTHALITGKQEEGTDVHSLNQKTLGLPSRKLAKTFIFAFVYGAGNAKIGSIIDKGAKEGGQLKGKFFRSLPKLKKLFDNIKEASRKTKKIRGLDGRVLHVRKDYAALNTRLQSSGAIVCKYWLINIMKEIRKEKLDAKLVLAVHDEYQFEVNKKDAERLGKICQEQMVKTGEQLNMRIPLLANYKIGNNWAETH